MARVDAESRRLGATILVAGCRGSGRTTAVESIRRRVPLHRIVGNAAGPDSIFDWLVIDLGRVAGWDLSIRIAALPDLDSHAQVRRVLAGEADGILFVADSQAARLENNLDAIRRLQEDLVDAGVDPRTRPQVYLYSKQDLPEDLVLPVEELDASLNFRGVPSRGGDLPRGIGVVESVQRLVSMVMRQSVAGTERR